jgi:pectin methylesterase-like acyl-CoA thioesterase
MKRSMLALLLTLTAVGATAATASSGRGTASLCVGSKPGCFSTIQAAINAAGDRTTIRIGSGTFAGGITIDRSLQITGAGPNSTTIRGGGPVVTIGTFLAPTEPTVSISDVTITGGVTTTSPESNPWVGKDNVIALGGGISILPADGYWDLRSVP